MKTQVCSAVWWVVHKIANSCRLQDGMDCGMLLAWYTRLLQEWPMGSPWAPLLAQY